MVGYPGNRPTGVGLTAHERLAMTEFYDFNKSPMSPIQQGRAEALRTAASVLSASTSLFGGKKPPEQVDDLLKVADWVLVEPVPVLSGADLLNSGQIFEIPRDQLPTFLSQLAHASENCGEDDCLVHGPMNAAAKVDPDDAKSEWTNVGTTETGFASPVDVGKGEVPWEQHGSNPDREIDPRDLSGGESDMDDVPQARPEGVRDYNPPNADPDLLHLDTVFVNDGMRWRVAEKANGRGKFWAIVGTELDEGSDEDLI